jgi:hypothetical protein
MRSKPLPASCLTQKCEKCLVQSGAGEGFLEEVRLQLDSEKWEDLERKVGTWQQLGQRE